MKPLRFGSFFSGVGMFDLAFERAGWACAFSCEIDAHARKVYAMRFGRPVTYEDVNAIDPGTVPAADAWVGGYPCQDNSVAGKRLGEAGERSNLVYRVFDLWAALPPRRRPRWLVLENVPGALTVGDGRAFGNVIAAMVDLGFGVSWRVLDGQHFGVAQRRRRVFIVADSRGTLDGPEEVLALAQGLRGGAAPGGAPRAGAAAGAQEGARERGVVNSIDTFGGGPDDNAAQTGHLVTQAVTSKWSKGTAPTLRNPHGTFGDALPAVFSIRADATREGAALTPSADADGRVRLRDPGMGVTEELAPTVDASTAHAVGPFPTLRGFGHGWQGQHNDDAARAGAVRRLTPSECEMLQGLRPGWTCTCGLVPAGPHEVEYDYRRPLAPAYTTAACKCKDGPRYKLIGNGGVVPCMEWIARRLGAAHGRKP